MSEFNGRKLGALISPPDERDYPVSSYVGIEENFPEEYIIPNLVEVYDQGNTAKCVAYSLAWIKASQEVKERGKYIPMSYDFIYSNRYPGQDSYRLLDFEGSYPRDLIKNLKNDGVCERELFTTNLPWEIAIMRITNEMRENAKQYKIRTYLRLYSNNEMKTALMKLGALSISIPITPKFVGDYNEMIDWDYVQKYRKGNHMVTIIGWEKKNNIEYWIGVNSWGFDWGNYDGLFYLPFGYPVNEAWSLTDEIVTHWAEKYWNYLNENGVKIYEKNYDAKITRGETFALLARYLGYKEQE